LSDKTRANVRSCLHDFWTWLRKRKIITLQQFPEFPEVSFELGWRKIIDKETQEAILDEIYRLVYHISPKVWIGIKWLSTYISIRPGELLSLTEENIDVKLGYFLIPTPNTKDKKFRFVPMIEEDMEIIKALPRGLPHLPFFRHVKGISGVKAGRPFGEKYFYKWWKKACANLGIDDVDLYGGTRHSTAMALREFATPEMIRRATMHSTNKAFERYFRIESEEVRDVYRLTNRRSNVVHTEQQPNNQKTEVPKGKLLKFKR
jgi:integrase